MSNVFSRILVYFFSYPLVLLIILIEVFALVLFFRSMKIRKERAKAEEKANHIKVVNEFYQEITNPVWLKHGGTMLEYTGEEE